MASNGGGEPTNCYQPNVGINPYYCPPPRGRWVWMPDVPSYPSYPSYPYQWPSRCYEVWC